MPEAAGLATSQVTIDTTAGGVLLAAARPGRRSVTIINHGTTVFFVGPQGLTTANGARVPGVEGASLNLETSGPVYGIVAADSQAVSVIETY